jgi:general secretion pathway protein G
MTRARVKAAQLQLKSTAAAVELFKDDLGRYPTAAEGLAVLVRQPNGAAQWTGPYVQDAGALNDPWASPIQYFLDSGGHRFQLKSLGADSAPGGSGADRDLVYPQPEAP